MPKPFNEELRDWRAKHGLYIKEACDIIGVSMSAYAKWEYGTRKPTQLSQAEIRRRMAAHPKPAST